VKPNNYIAIDQVRYALDVLGQINHRLLIEENVQSFQSERFYNIHVNFVKIGSKFQNMPFKQGYY